MTNAGLQIDAPATGVPGICKSAGHGAVLHDEGAGEATVGLAATRREATPASEYSERFWELMVNRMGMSFCKYGPLRDAYPHKVNALHSLLDRIRQYEATGNTEYLVDVANFAMIEFMRPSNKNAHFEATDASGSPGRRWRDKKQPTQQGNHAEAPA